MLLCRLPDLIMKSKHPIRIATIYRCLSSMLGSSHYQLQKIEGQGDLVFYRVTYDDTSMILVDGNQVPEVFSRYCQYAQVLHQQGIAIPHCHPIDAPHQLLLQTDLGPECLTVVYDGGTNHKPVWLALECLLDWQLKSKRLPPLTSTPLPEKKPTSTYEAWRLKQPLLTSFEQQCQASAIEPILTHGAFHSKNLFLVGTHRIFIIHFHHAFQAPLTYDLASILFDPAICWDQRLIQHWLQYYHRQAANYHLTASPLSDFELDFYQQALRQQCLYLSTYTPCSSAPSLSIIDQHIRTIMAECPPLQPVAELVLQFLKQLR